MSEALIIALLNFATKFGIDAALAIGNRLNQPGATLSDAIAALEDIQKKGAKDYLAEAGGPANPPAVELPPTPKQPPAP